MGGFVYHGRWSVNATASIRLFLAATLAGAICLAQQPRSVLVGRVVAAGSGRPLAAAKVTFQPEEGHQVTLLRGWVGAAPRQVTHTDARGRFRIPSQTAGCLLVQHQPSGLGAILHRAAPNSFYKVQARPMGELVLPGAGQATAHVLAVSPAGRETHLGPWPGPRIRLPEGRYRLLVDTGQGWSELRCQVVSAHRQPLELTAGAQTLRLFDGFRGRVTLMGWPRIALSTAGGKVRVPAGPGPRILQVWEERDGCILLQESWIQHPVQSLRPASRDIRLVEVVDGNGRAVPGALCFSGYRGPGGVRVVSRSQSNAQGLAPVANVAKEPTGFVLVLKRGHAVGHVEVFGTDGRVPVQLQRGHSFRLLVLGPRGDPQPNVEVQLRPVAAPWGARSSFTDPKGEVLFTELALGEARVLLLGTRFLMEEHPVRVTETARPVRIQARRGHEIQGQVLLPSGRPAAHALVVVRDPRGSLPVAEVVASTGPDGRFTVAGLPKGTSLVLTAERRVHEPARAPLGRGPAPAGKRQRRPGSLVRIPYRKPSNGKVAPRMSLCWAPNHLSISVAYMLRKSVDSVLNGIQ
jgi:hypothetical protein